MILTGIADEAGALIDAQIKATKELGWNTIEARTVEVPG
ncbi:MAG TPA: xylose isomerase, partial [Verrucomicrobiales bacterium]|nr:xylose isomerase [Verrucomicrobiales bacterium]